MTGFSLACWLVIAPYVTIIAAFHSRQWLIIRKALSLLSDQTVNRSSSGARLVIFHRLEDHDQC